MVSMLLSINAAKEHVQNKCPVLAKSNEAKTVNYCGHVPKLKIKTKTQI